jgi:hypothetical protein
VEFFIIITMVKKNLKKEKQTCSYFVTSLFNYLLKDRVVKQHDDEKLKNVNEKNDSEDMKSNDLKFDNIKVNFEDDDKIDIKN